MEAVETHQAVPARAGAETYPAVPEALASEPVHGAVGFTYDLPQMKLITTPAQFAQIAPTLIHAPSLALDTETTGLDPLTDRLRLIQLFRPDTVYLIDVTTVPPALLNPIFTTPKRWIGHNLKFDVKMLVAAGLPWPRGTFMDTMLASQLLSASGSEEPIRHALEDVVRRELAVTLDKTLQTSDWSGPLSSEQLEYAARDAGILWPLADVLTEQIMDAELDQVLAIEGDCLPAVSWMELSGLPFDAGHWQTLTAREASRLPQLRAEMAALLNGYATDLFGTCGVNWDSRAHVFTLLQARGHCLENTATQTLKRLMAHDPLISLLVAYRQSSKRVSSFGDPWVQRVHPVTSRMHPTYWQCGSRAGRMSCSAPNIQQIPRASDYRAAIAAPAGHTITKADYSQIELRIAAAMARDTTMLQAFHDGQDLHQVTASLVLGIPQAQVTAQHRQIAKSLNFGLLYGMGSKGLQAYAASTFGVVMTEAEAVRHRKRFFQTYAGLQRWHADTGHRLDRGKTLNTRTLAGRVRFQTRKFTDCLNTPVQGTGADGLKSALGRLFRSRESVPTARLIACVHDEIVAESLSADAEATAAWLKGHMEAAMQELIGDLVPVVVDIHTGQTWAGTRD
jgi:DNA polymerase I